MRKLLLPLLAVAALFAALPTGAEAQVKPRWRLIWRNSKPLIHTHRTPSGDHVNYWYCTYEVTNVTDEIIPLILDVQLYVHTGKDLQHDLKKVDIETAKDILDVPNRAEAQRFGRFYSNVLVPQDVEYKIIERDARLSNRSQGIIEESIEAFKKGDEEGNRWYLNPREIRQARFIGAGKKLHGIAIFRDVEPRARVIELHVSGLVDIIRVEAIDEFDVKMHYENKVLHIRYDYAGDEFSYEGDWLESDLVRTSEKWHVKKIGPVASKETIGRLSNALLEAYKLEREGKGENSGLTQLDINIMARVFKIGTGIDFGWDETKSLMENERAIWRMHEWWLTNRSKLIFNPVLNRFEPKDEKLPGEVGRDE